MLAYLESLCAAVVARDHAAIRRALRDPQAYALPRRVRDEILAVMRARPESHIAPVHTLHFYHQSVQLFLEEPVTRRRRSKSDDPQLELPLRPFGDLDLSDRVVREERSAASHLRASPDAA